MVSSVEQKVKIILIVESILFVLAVAKLLSVIALATFFNSEFDDYVRGNLDEEQNKIFAEFDGTLKYSLVFIVILIGVLIDAALLYYLYRGIQKRESKILTRWTIFGWILVVFAACGLFLALIQNRPRGSVQTIGIIYSMIYVTYRVFANIFVLMFATEVKGEYYEQMGAFKRASLNGMQ